MQLRSYLEDAVSDACARATDDRALLSMRAVTRPSGGAGGAGQAAGSLRLPGRTAGSSPHSDPLYQLLRSYLHHFLPQPATGAAPNQRHHSAYL